MCVHMYLDMLNVDRADITNGVCFVSTYDQVHCNQLTVSQRDVKEAGGQRRVVKIGVVFPTRVSDHRSAMRKNYIDPINVRRKKPFSYIKRRDTNEEDSISNVHSTSSSVDFTVEQNSPDVQLQKLNEIPHRRRERRCLCKLR